MNVMFASKDFQIQVRFVDINEHTLQTSLMNVSQIQLLSNT
jgi:hypothetical protein